MLNYYIKHGSTLFLLFWTCILLSCKDSDSGKLRIAAAASLQYAIEDLTNDFTERTGIECEIIIGSSGKLTAQIMQGAPYNIFLSADMKYPVFLEENDKAHQSPEIYAYGKLIVYTPKESLAPELNNVLLPSVQKIAIANPQTAPYGEATLELLRRENLYDSIKHKLVYGESIAQANQFITTAAVSMGFTSLSSVMAGPMATTGKWQLLDEASYTPIAHGVIILDVDTGENVAASKFYTYLLSEEAGQILEEFGYSRNE